MTRLTRLTLFAAGLIIVLIARAQLRMGHVIFSNVSYHQTTFAASGFGIGLVLVLLAFLPSKDWVNKHITTREVRSKPLIRR